MLKLADTEKRTVDALTELFFDDLQAVLKTSRTGAPDSIPESHEARAQLLNMFLYQPEFLLVFSGQIAFSHLDVYRPYLARTKRKFAVLATGIKGKTWGDLGLKNTQFYLNSKELDPLRYLPSISGLNAFMYVSHKAYNYKCISRNKNVVHTYSGHGFSDKHTAEFRLASAYDYLLRPDASSMRRFADADIAMSPSQFLLIGGLPVEGMKVHTGPAKFDKILYAPTWEGHGSEVNFSSITDVSDALVAFASDGGELTFRAHPGLGKVRPELKLLANEVTAVAGPRNSKANEFNQSDAIISDISGVLPEYLFSGKPIIIPVPGSSWKKDYLKKTDLEQYCYIWDPEAKSLKQFVAGISHDPLGEARTRRRAQRFLGSANLDELCGHFERSLDFMEQAKYQRKLKALSASPEDATQINGIEKRHNDGDINDIIAKIRSGKTMLGIK